MLDATLNFIGNNILLLVIMFNQLLTLFVILDLERSK